MLRSCFDRLLVTAIQPAPRHHSQQRRCRSRTRSAKQRGLSVFRTMSKIGNYALRSLLVVGAAAVRRHARAIQRLPNESPLSWRGGHPSSSRSRRPTSSGRCLAMVAATICPKRSVSAERSILPVPAASTQEAPTSGASSITSCRRKSSRRLRDLGSSAATKRVMVWIASASAPGTST